MNNQPSLEQLLKRFNKLIDYVCVISYEQGHREFSGGQWAREMREELQNLKLLTPQKEVKKINERPN